MSHLDIQELLWLLPPPTAVCITDCSVFVFPCVLACNFDKQLNENNYFYIQPFLHENNLCIHLKCIHNYTSAYWKVPSRQPKGSGPTVATAGPVTLQACLVLVDKLNVMFYPIWTSKCVIKRKGTEQIPVRFML